MDETSGAFQAYHKTLQRQIRKFLGEDPVVSPQLEQLLHSVSSAYVHADEDRELIERSLELSSRELTDTNKKIRDEVAAQAKELYKEHARFIASINSLSAGFIMCDPLNRVTMINAAARLLLSVSPASPGSTDEITSVDMYRVWSVEEIGAIFGTSVQLEERFATVLKTRKPLEQKSIAFGGHVLNIFFAPILDKYDSQSEVLGTVMLIEDVTEEKILERSKDEFFSIASHELRTPLTTIRGNTSIMQEYYAEQLRDPELRTMVDDMHQSSIRLINIVNDFLDVSRLEQGKTIFKTEQFGIANVIESVMHELASVGSERGIELRFDTAAMRALPRVVGDQGRVRQVVYNLIGNALKFMDKGNITIDAKQQDKSVKVTVSDTGIGMTPDAQQLLFHKFQQASNSLLTRDSSRGTGLGLYISKLLIEQMHGHIQLESSAPGIGSVFSFTLPIA
jgi:signal transduction histidine kinase